MKTVLITGCSSGYGLETARHFHAQGWSVIATMRNPREDVLPRSERLHVVALDVTKPHSIAAALEASGPIDVLVNNAGVGLFGAFEATAMATAREVFDTNTFGVMAMTQAVLPQFRARRSGVVVNVTSSATLAPMPMVPMVAVYTASKMAIEVSLPESRCVRQLALPTGDLNAPRGQNHCANGEMLTGPYALNRCDEPGVLRRVTIFLRGRTDRRVIVPAGRLLEVGGLAKPEPARRQAFRPRGVRSDDGARRLPGPPRRWRRR